MNMHLFRRSLLYLGVMVMIGFGLIALAGCAHRPPEIVIQYIETPLADRIPESLIVCAGDPSTGSFAMQSGVATYIMKLRSARHDCWSKNTAIGDIVRADTARLKAGSIGETTTTGGQP